MRKLLIGFEWNDLDRWGLIQRCLGLDRLGLDWFRFDWFGLDWFRLDWFRLDITSLFL